MMPGQLDNGIAPAGSARAFMAQAIQPLFQEKFRTSGKPLLWRSVRAAPGTRAGTDYLTVFPHYLGVKFKVGFNENHWLGLSARCPRHSETPALMATGIPHLTCNICEEGEIFPDDDGLIVKSLSVQLHCEHSQAARAKRRASVAYTRPQRRSSIAEDSSADSVAMFFERLESIHSLDVVAQELAKQNFFLELGKLQTRWCELLTAKISP